MAWRLQATGGWAACKAFGRLGRVEGVIEWRRIKVARALQKEGIEGVYRLRGQSAFVVCGLWAGEGDDRAGKAEQAMAPYGGYRARVISNA